MSGERPFSPYLKFGLLGVALVGLLVSVTMFAFVAYLFVSFVLIGFVNFGLGVVLVSWLAANVYAAMLIVKAGRQGYHSGRSQSCLGAVTLMVPAAIFGVFTIWAIMSFAGTR
ncbi:MAG: hypothetical protein IPL62_07015 [Caulobacteraceae bacterium]|nr:hypothetical protein [Caulobacteraceae bacterium]